MIFTLKVVCIVILWGGIFITTLGDEKDKRKQIGWLILSCATFVDSLLVLYEGRIISGGIIFVFSLIDFYLYNFWRKRYNKLIDNVKMDNKHKFIKDIQKYRFDKNGRIML